jgi:alkylhydroperoxidase family enzyme
VDAYEYHRLLLTAGESDLRHEQRLYLLDAWRESKFYSERERAALGWCEAVTRIAETHAPDDCYEAARAQFKKKELVELTFAIVAINGLTGSTSHFARYQETIRWRR